MACIMSTIFNLHRRASSQSTHLFGTLSQFCLHYSLSKLRARSKCNCLLKLHILACFSRSAQTVMCVRLGCLWYAKYRIEVHVGNT